MESALERYSGNTGTPDLSTFFGEEMVRNARGYHYKTDDCASIRAETFWNFKNRKKPKNSKNSKMFLHESIQNEKLSYGGVDHLTRGIRRKKS